MAQSLSKFSFMNKERLLLVFSMKESYDCTVGRKMINIRTILHISLYFIRISMMIFDELFVDFVL